MSRQQLSLSARPKTLNALVGQGEIVRMIRQTVKSGLVQNAWLFTGPRGNGKTTIARIIALSFQCDHQTAFGQPCRKCRINRASFDIHEINAAKIRGVVELEQNLEGSEYAPRTGKYRVYVIDELHQSSDKAQDLLLKYVEDAPKSTMFILCSTRPDRIVGTLVSRCMLFQLRELEMDDITILTERLLNRIGSDLPADRLVEALVDKGVGAPRLIANAVEKYVGGMEPDTACEVEIATAVNIRPLTRAVIKGDWLQAAVYLAKMQITDVNPVRLGMIQYLRTLLLKSTEISGRTRVVAISITALCALHKAEDVAMQGGLCAALYKITSFFSKYAVG